MTDRFAPVLVVLFAAVVAVAFYWASHAITRRDRRRPLTERRAREAELRRSNEELERFAFVASHDLKEPLRMITGYLQLLAKRYPNQLDDEAKTFIDYAVDGAERMHRLIDDLLAYARVDSRGCSLEPVDANQIVRDALKNLEGLVAEAGATIEVEPLPTIRADRRQLVRVFQNMVENAIKFRGPAAPRIEIFARQVDGRWRFSVGDNGIGIDPEHFDRLFVIFGRLHGRADHPGSGLGLAISKKIIELHGGDLWVESAPGSGSTFHFTVPAQT